MKILVDKEGKRFFVDENRDIHTHSGTIKKQKLKLGQVVKTNTNTEFLVLEPEFVDYFEKMKRGPQIIILKDAGIISAYTGIASGSKVVEAGSGSGALTSYLANLVKPNGKVFSYERKSSFQDIAKANVEKIGLGKYVTFKDKDISEISEKDVDVVILDLPNPWDYLENVEKAIKTGGFLVIYVPTVNQLIKAQEKINETSLKVFKTCEIIERGWNVGDASRPKNIEIGHTAFLMFARKLK